MRSPPLLASRQATSRIRTDDPVITSDVLYQLSYGGDQADGLAHIADQPGVEPRGIEPLTSALRTLRSPN